MAKISKPVLKMHNEALDLLERGDLTFYEREQVYDELDYKPKILEKAPTQISLF